jgi:transposase
MCSEFPVLELRAIVMEVINDHAKAGVRRVEVLTGPTRRRRWSASEKGRIVAETLQAGTTVTEVARRWQVCPQQVWCWRREARAGELALPSEAVVAAMPSFVPIVVEPAAPATAASAEPLPEQTTKVVRVATGTDMTLLSDVLRAVRASAS